MTDQQVTDQSARPPTADDVEHVPTVSIGLAVFNGENYLEEAIDSILAQTFTDFELIISDNASSDRTQEIAERYVAIDSRIRYYRNERNIGGANNENLTFELARGRYFRLAAHDDILAPRLLEACVEVLDRDPGVVLCYPRTIEIDGEGRPLDEKRIEGRGTASRPSQRFAELVFRDHSCEPTYGLIRPEVLRMTPLQENYVDSDRVLLCELAMFGRFEELPERLFYKRMHERNVYVDWRARMAWFDPSRKGKPSLPNWLALRGIIRVVAHARISRRERARCALTVGRWVVRYSPRLGKDLAVAALVLLRRGRHHGKDDRNVYNWE